MKAKNITLVLIGLLFYMTDANAQTRFYDTPRTFHEQGFTYVSRLMAGVLVQLHNQNNQWINVPLANRDGTPLGHPIYSPGPPTVQIDNDVHMTQLARTIVRNAFSPAEMQRIRGSRLGVSMYIDSNTGRVMGVRFTFAVDHGFATIPVSTYRRIEVELMNRIQFIPTAEGRRRNFLFRSFDFEP